MSSVGPGRWPCLTASGARGTRCRGSKPQRDQAWLCGLVNDRKQLGGEGVKVELVAQTGAEGLDGLGRVVAAAVEAAIHDRLDAAAGRLEQGGHGQGGAGYGQGRFPSDRVEELAQAKHPSEVDGPEQDREQPVDQGAAD